MSPWLAPPSVPASTSSGCANDLFLRSAPVLLAAVAQATERIEIGSCILDPQTIHPG